MEDEAAAAAEGSLNGCGVPFLFGMFLWALFPVGLFPKVTEVLGTSLDDRALFLQTSFRAIPRERRRLFVFVDGAWPDRVVILVALRETISEGSRYGSEHCSIVRLQQVVVQSSITSSL